MNRESMLKLLADRPRALADMDYDAGVCIDANPYKTTDPRYMKYASQMQLRYAEETYELAHRQEAG